MLNKSTVQLMALGLVGSFAATAAAQDSGALIDALVRKGVLKDQEAEQIRTQLSRDFAANTPAGKLNLSSSVKELKLSGDVRARWQYDNRDPQTNGSLDTGDQRSRFRLRLRINGDYKLNDNFFAGFGLQTEQKADSGNQTMAGDGSGGAGQGEYFENYNVYISKAFVGWNPVSGVTLVAGKQINPFYTTDMVWDADINPTGFTQRVDLHKLFSLGALELSLVSGQFIVADTANESAVRGSDAYSKGNNRDAWIYQNQLIATLPITESIKATIAPSYYCSNGAYYNYSNSEANLGAKQLDGMKIVTAPGDVSFKVAGLPVKFQWDLAYNKDATDRTRLLDSTSSFTAAAAQSISGYTEKTVSAVAAAGATPSTFTNNQTGATITAPLGTVVVGYTETTKGTAAVTAVSASSTYSRTVSVTPSGTDSLAYLLGFQIGENKKKGDWSLIANYRQVGLSAVDPNINDSDWALSYTNMAGYKVGFLYNLGDATTIGTTYYSADNLRTDLGVGGPTPGSAGPGSGRNSVQVLQVDVSVKF